MELERVEFLFMSLCMNVEMWHVKWPNRRSHQVYVNEEQVFLTRCQRETIPIFDLGQGLIILVI